MTDRVSPRLQFITAMVGSALAILAGLVILRPATDSSLVPLGWFLLVVGLISVVANVLIRRRMP